MRAAIIATFSWKFHMMNTTDHYLPYYNGAFIAFAVLYFSTLMFGTLFLFFSMFFRRFTDFERGSFCNIVPMLLIMPVALVTDCTETFYILFNGRGLSKESEDDSVLPAKWLKGVRLSASIA